jgi:transcriptional regulator GlxA family with amidase domain
LDLDVLTAAGRTAAMDMMLELIAERLFATAFGQCPSEFYLEFRLKEAR